MARPSDDADDDDVLCREFGYMDAANGLYPYTMDYESVQVGFPNFWQTA